MFKIENKEYNDLCSETNLHHVLVTVHRNRMNKTEVENFLKVEFLDGILKDRAIIIPIEIEPKNIYKHSK